MLTEALTLFKFNTPVYSQNDVNTCTLSLARIGFYQRWDRKQRNPGSPRQKFAFLDGLMSKVIRLTNALNVKKNHSSRRAVVGSSPAARRAGSHDAIAEMAKNTTVIAVNVSGSVGFMPTSMADMARVRMIAAINPAPIPIELRANP
jgi:hypothetical protein